ncbi:MAG: class I SAM-dependent methyltransferase [Clostridiales bacterium]|nr:class I SAM-dependent methyltransferase [Clostridiales bacterium]
MGGGEKLERWGEIKVIRPDPQIIWPRSGDISLWKNAHMRYTRSRSGGGRWETLRPVPASWEISYKLNADSVEPDALKFHIRPTDFKHMGLFPEQAVNWEWAAGLIRNAGRPVRVLNLFGYTGGATVACLSAGAEVTHIDAAKGMNQWAKDNISLSNLSRVKHRVLADDAVKFIKREERRGSFYDAIIMDPPVYGRGPGGELWKLEDRLFELVCACAKILSKQPLFVLLNAYTAGFSPIVAANVLQKSLSGLSLPCRVSCGEIGLRASAGGLVLPCGMYGRCEF